MRVKGFNPKQRTTGNWEILKMGQMVFPREEPPNLLPNAKFDNITQTEKAVFMYVGIYIHV